MRLTRLSSGGGPPVYPPLFIGLDPGNSHYNVPIRITPPRPSSHSDVCHVSAALWNSALGLAVSAADHVERVFNGL